MLDDQANGDGLPEDFEDHTHEAFRTEMRQAMAAQNQRLAMLMECVKALAEGRSVVVHSSGQIFVQAPSIIPGSDANN